MPDLPEPTEEYQRTLMAFIAEIPPLGGPEIVSGTPDLRAPFTKAQIDDLKDVTTDARFKRYTGWDHKALLEKWLVDKTTTCNEFVSRCVAVMGYKSQTDNIGRFDIADRLLTRGLSHVWVPADSGATPEYGDVVRLYEASPDQNGVATNHMAVSLAADGTEWYTVESGQGGPKNGARFDQAEEKRVEAQCAAGLGQHEGPAARR